MKVATLVYLDWSDKPITFDQSDHLKREGFLLEVGGSSEADGQIKLSRGQDALPGDDPVKGCRTSPDRGQIDLQELEGLGVDDVEVAASVHEDLGVTPQCHLGFLSKCQAKNHYFM